MRQVIENRYIEPCDLHSLLKRLFGAGNYEVEVGDARSSRYLFDTWVYEAGLKLSIKAILGKEETLCAKCSPRAFRRLS